jgi:hypothetical protein
MTTRVRRELVRGTGGRWHGRESGSMYVVRGGPQGTRPVVVMGKARANEVMGARRRLLEKHRERAERARRER